MEETRGRQDTQQNNSKKDKQKKKRNRSKSRGPKTGGDEAPRGRSEQRMENQDRSRSRSRSRARFNEGNLDRALRMAMPRRDTIDAPQESPDQVIGKMDLLRLGSLLWTTYKVRANSVAQRVVLSRDLIHHGGWLVHSNITHVYVLGKPSSEEKMNLVFSLDAGNGVILDEVTSSADALKDDRHLFFVTEGTEIPDHAVGIIAREHDYVLHNSTDLWDGDLTTLFKVCGMPYWWFKLLAKKDAPYATYLLNRFWANMGVPSNYTYGESEMKLVHRCLKYILQGWKYTNEWTGLPTFVKNPKLKGKSGIRSDLAKLQVLAQSNLVLSPYVEAEFFEQNIKLKTLSSFLGFATKVAQNFYMTLVKNGDKAERRPTVHVWEFIRCASVAIVTGSKWLLSALVKDAYDRGVFHHETWRPQKYIPCYGWLRASAKRNPLFTGIFQEKAVHKASSYYVVGSNGTEYLFSENDVGGLKEVKYASYKHVDDPTVVASKMKVSLPDLPPGNYWSVSAQALFWGGQVKEAPKLLF